MRSPLLILALLAAAACDPAPVEWADPRTVPAARASRLVVDSAGDARFVADSSPNPVFGGERVCPRSVRAAWSASGLRAVYWRVRPDSSAGLYMTTSSDSGRTWGGPVPVDTGDVSDAGCDRPAPAIAASGSDLHIAYSMVASEGTGVFFAHQLQSMVHSPVAVIYGDRLVPTAIAVDGDRVAVAYEDPNGKRRQVAVALSTSQGHIFESHIIASRDVDVATDPAVALADHRLAVSWSAPQPSDSSTTRTIRQGRIH
jgi:hypothetical protein